MAWLGEARAKAFNNNNQKGRANMKIWSLCAFGAWIPMSIAFVALAYKIEETFLVVAGFVYLLLGVIGLSCSIIDFFKPNR